MRIINTVLPLVVLAVHVAGLHIPSDGGSYSKRSDLGSAKAVERRGPHAIASRSGPPDPTPGSFLPSTDKVERRSPTPNPKGGGGGGHGGGGGGGHSSGGTGHGDSGGHSHSDGEGGGGSHSRGSSSIASAEAVAAHDATLAKKICQSHFHLGREQCADAQKKAAKAKQEADKAQQDKAKLRRRMDSWSDLD